MKEKFEKLRAERKEKRKEKREEKAKKKLKKLLIRLGCLAVLCCGGAVVYKFRYPILKAIIDKKIAAQKLAAKAKQGEKKCPCSCKLFGKQ